MSAENPNRPARAFTLIELLVVIAIIAVLAALIFPAVTSVRRKADNAKCVQNLKTWGLAINRYAQENEGIVRWREWASISGAARFYNPYFGTEAVMVKGDEKFAQEYFRWCPTQDWTGENAPVGYAFIRPSSHAKKGNQYWPVDQAPKPGEDPPTNYAPYNLRQVEKPSQLLWMIDAITLNMSGIGDFEKFVKPLCVKTEGQEIRHGGSVNALFADGHVASYSWEDLDQSTPEETAMMESWFRLD